MGQSQLHSFIIFWIWTKECLKLDYTYTKPHRHPNKTCIEHFSSKFCKCVFTMMVQANNIITVPLQQGWPNHCPGAKKCPPRLLHVPSKLFLKIAFFKNIFRNLQNLILKCSTLGAGIELDMV